MDDIQFDDLIDFEDYDNAAEVDQDDDLDNRDVAPTETETETQELDDNHQEDESIEATTTDDDEDSSVPQGYFDFLTQTGAISVPDDFKFDGSVESFQKAIDLSKKQTAAKISQDVWEALPPDFKPLLEYGLAGGKDLNEYLKAYAPIDYDNVDTSDEETQKRIIREHWKQTSNHSDEKISRLIARLEDKGDLEEEALDSLEELKSIQSAKKANLAKLAEQQLQAEREAAQEQAAQLYDVIEKAPYLEDERRKRVKAFVATPVRIDDRITTGFDQALQSVFSNPDHFIQLADVLADYNPKKGFDFERLKRKAKSENVATFRELVNTTLNNKPSGGTVKRSLKEDFDLEQFLER